jgi:PLP dependent protein
MSSIAANLQGVNARIDAAIAGRRNASKSAPIAEFQGVDSGQFAPFSGNAGTPVTLVAVSKTKPASDVREAVAAGHRHFGENYVQEALAKIEALAELRAPNVPQHDCIVWHLIGPLQSNKAKLVATHFDWVHSVDRSKIATALAANRPPELPPLNVLIQVNVSGEASKSGVTLDDDDTSVMQLAAYIAALPQLRLRGLMTIVEDTDDEVALRFQFRRLADAFGRLRASAPHVDTLSMGMSQDFEIAIDEGSNMVRVGRAIFGERAAPIIDATGTSIAS